MPDPLDSTRLEHVRFFTQAPVIPVMATADDIDRAIVLYCGGSTDLHEVRAAAF